MGEDGLKPRERVFAAIEHRRPDRTPLDLRARPETFRELRDYFGVRNNDDVLRELGVDFRPITMYPSTDSEFAGLDRETYLFKGYDLQEWGIRMEMGSTNEFWHFTYHPLAHMELGDYYFPDIDTPGRFDVAEKEARKWEGDYAISGQTWYGLFELGWFLRGYRNFIRDLYTRPEFVSKLLDRILEWKLEAGKRLVEVGADIIEVSDDLGTQTGLMISPSLIREYFMPRYERWFSGLKKAGALVLFHSDGAIESIIPELMDTGIDVLNPVQPECMDPARVKQLYGERLAFHGTISVQQTLPFGSVEDVRNEVATRIQTVGYNGGLILCPANAAQHDVPVENLVALYTTAKTHPVP